MNDLQNDDNSATQIVRLRKHESDTGESNLLEAITFAPLARQHKDLSAALAKRPLRRRSQSQPGCRHPAYQLIISQYDQDRKTGRTAIFRLANRIANKEKPTKRAFV